MQPTNFLWFDFPVFPLLNAIITTGSLAIFGAYNKMWRYFNIKDYRACVFGVFVGIVVCALLQAFVQQTQTILFVTSNFFAAAAGVIIFRLIFRGAFLNIETEVMQGGTRTLIVGAGKSTRMILTELKNSASDEDVENIDICPVALVDDDSSKFGLEIEGIRVIGNSSEIPEIVKSYNIEGIILSIPSAKAEEKNRILNIVKETGCKIRVIPYISQLVFTDNRSIISQIQDIKLEDLLGREPVTFNNKKVRELVSGKISLVTGGGGSIGSELVRQIAKYSPQKIIILDNYENSAYDIQQELIMDYGKTLDVETIIASVQDYSKMEKVFKTYSPNLVFHAAAHKHVPLMETVPEEAVKNNILGTFNVSSLAEQYGVDKFIMISTDKAVNPTNVMGATKRCCEMVIQHKAQHHKHTEFVTTRFGNVLGSNGSVIPLFKKQIETGRPVTVTHKDVTRFFMTIPEAVSLVLQAGAMAKGGEIFVLDMGEPVKILSLAENVIKLYGKKPYSEVKIKFTGLRPGEKLFEELLMDEEGLQATENQKIFIGNQINVDSTELLSKLERLMSKAKENDSEKVVELLKDLVPTFKRS
ncbi:MAG: polysaccharide biosynthesis protein [Oscillospiraceae bacterium]|nr:polysaccharide biosynthesis protein [Oscillospiraceae bacterium]